MHHNASYGYTAIHFNIWINTVAGLHHTGRKDLHISNERPHAPAFPSGHARATQPTDALNSSASDPTGQRTNVPRNKSALRGTGRLKEEQYNRRTGHQKTHFPPPHNYRFN